MICSNCHSSNAPGAKFCAVCGAGLHENKVVESWDENKTQAVDEAYDYDDGFSVKQSDLDAERKDYEYYPEDNGYNDNSYGNNDWNSGYGNNGNRNNGYDNNGYGGGYNSGYNGGYNNSYNNGGNGYGGGYNNTYGGGYNDYNGYNSGYNNYGSNTLKRSTRSVGAIIIYMISGALALAIMLMTVLPSMDVLQAVDNAKIEGPYSQYSEMIKSQAKETIKKQYEENGEETTRNVFQFVKNAYDVKGENKSDFQVMGTIILLMFVTPMIFLLLWAIFSFCRNRAAGSMGLVGCISFIAVGVYWLLYLMNELPIGKLYVTGSTEKIENADFSQNGITVGLTDAITVVPYLMIGLGVAGIVLAALQLSKRDRVR